MTMFHQIPHHRKEIICCCRVAQSQFFIHKNVPSASSERIRSIVEKLWAKTLPRRRNPVSSRGPPIAVFSSVVFFLEKGFCVRVDCSLSVTLQENQNFHKAIKRTGGKHMVLAFGWWPSVQFSSHKSPQMELCACDFSHFLRFA